MVEIAEYSYLYELGAKLEEAYRAGGMECREVDDLSDQIIAAVCKIDTVALGLILAGARSSKVRDFDKYDWVCGVIEAYLQKRPIF